jgi:hypothetical protein
MWIEMAMVLKLECSIGFTYKDGYRYSSGYNFIYMYEYDKELSDRYILVVISIYVLLWFLYISYM